MLKKIITLVVLLAAAGGGYYYYTQYGEAKPKPQITQAAITEGAITEVVQATGSLEAVRTYPVGSQVSGTVLHVYKDFNDIVKKGQVLADIDPSLLQAQVDLQQANLERQQGEIINQQTQLEDSKTQLQRTQALFDAKLTNQQTLDQAILTVKSRQTSLDAAKLSLKQNQAQLDQAKLNVSYTVIKAPDDGVIVNRLVDVGQTVQSSVTVANFFSIATDLHLLKLNAGVDEAEIGKVRRGMTVLFTVDSYQGRTFQGTVQAVRLNAQNSSGVVTYPVWIDAPNPDLTLKPSMTATVRIVTNSAADAVRIPNAALRFRPTADMYTALGLTPPPAPAAGAGRRGGGRGGPGGTDDTTVVPGATPGTAATPSGRQTAGAAGGARGTQTAANGQTAAAGQGQRTRGQNGQTGAGAQGANGQVAGNMGRGGAGGGRGFGGNANMTPEERQRMIDQFRANGGGRGGGRGGAGGGQNAGGRGGGANGTRGFGRGQQAVVAAPALSETDADKIDDLFQPIQTRASRGQVWTWDEATKKLTEIPVTYGIRDDSASQLITGDVKPGMQVVTNIVVPQTAAQRQQQNSLFGGQQGRGGGGLQQGNFGGGGGPAGGGGFGGGGGGGGGGRGGGGRGGD